MRLVLKIFLALTVITVVLAVLAGCSSDTGSAAPQVGKLAPDFKYKNATGEKVFLSDLRGKTIMLNFWATWCGYCQYEMPLIEELANNKERAEQGLVVLTVNVGESADTIDAFMSAYGYTFTVLLDTQSAIAEAYHIRYYPTTFFIGPDGIISLIRPGAFMNESQLEQVLNSIRN